MQFWRIGHPPKERKEETGRLGGGVVGSRKTPSNSTISFSYFSCPERGREEPEGIP